MNKVNQVNQVNQVVQTKPRQFSVSFAFGYTWKIKYSEHCIAHLNWKIWWCNILNITFCRGWSCSAPSLLVPEVGTSFFLERICRRRKDTFDFSPTDADTSGVTGRLFNIPFTGVLLHKIISPHSHDSSSFSSPSSSSHPFRCGVIQESQMRGAGGLTKRQRLAGQRWERRLVGRHLGGKWTGSKLEYLGEILVEGAWGEVLEFWLLCRCWSVKHKYEGTPC